MLRSFEEVPRAVLLITSSTSAEHITLLTPLATRISPALNDVPLEPPRVLQGIWGAPPNHHRCLHIHTYTRTLNNASSIHLSSTSTSHITCSNTQLAIFPDFRPFHIQKRTRRGSFVSYTFSERGERVRLRLRKTSGRGG